MSNKRTDIWQQIRKYLNGELDDRAMHRLERRSQADPFLRDALDGYQLKSIDHDKNLNDLASRLKNRTSRRERRIIPLKFIATAATILIFLFAGILWYINRPMPLQQKIELAKIKSRPPVKSKPIDMLLTIGKKTEIAVLTKNNPPHAHKSINQQKYIVQNMQPVPEADASVSPPAGNSDAKVTEADPTRIYPDSSHGISSSIARANKNALADIAITGRQENTITGTVTAKDDGLPIPGVTIQVKGTAIGTQTNDAGKFTLSGVPKGAKLVIAFVGYNTQQITVDKKDAIAVIMQPNTNSLAEVVVTGASGIKKNNTDDEQVYESAQPVNGWSDFKKYLKDNAVSPDGKEGVVKVSFTVNGYGLLNDFKIKKSLSDQDDNIAIKLIQNGPRWKTNGNHTTETVTVRVRFKQKH